MRKLLLSVAGAFALLAGSAQAETGRAATPAVACLAEAVYHEARGQGDRGALAVAHVVLNRERDPEFPGSICDVVQDGCQFSYRCNRRSLALRDPDERARAFRVAEKVLAGATPDPTDGALFFHSSAVKPGWFSSRPRTAEIGGNVFYR